MLKRSRKSCWRKMLTWVNAVQVETYQMDVLWIGPCTGPPPERPDRTIPLGKSIYVPAFFSEPEKPGMVECTRGDRTAYYIFQKEMGMQVHMPGRGGL